MVTIAVISDSHIPERAASIPESFRERVATADHVVHAGDFTDPDTLETVRDLVGERLTAVYGNMDPRNLDLPAVASLEAGGVEFVVTHGTGDLETYESRVAEVVREQADADAVGIAGHTHEVLGAVVDGVRLLNPGSVTGAPPAERATMLELTVEDGDLAVTVHEA
jgi:putative phosphoesterase